MEQDVKCPKCESSDVLTSLDYFGSLLRARVRDLNFDKLGLLWYDQVSI